MRTQTAPIYINGNLFIVTIKTFDVINSMKELSPSYLYRDAKSHGDLWLQTILSRNCQVIEFTLNFYVDEGMLSSLAERWYAFEVAFDVSSNETADDIG